MHPCNTEPGTAAAPFLEIKMAKKIDTGGPAFPEGESWTSTDLAGNRTEHAKGVLRLGMTLRQYYAGQALAGLMAYPDDTKLDFKEWANSAFSFADAMIAHEKGEQA